MDLILPMTSTISSDSTHNQIPSAKAIWDALAAITPDGYEEFQDKVTALETALGEVLDSSTGILANAKKYTDELANGQVKTNKTAIENLGNLKADKATTLAGYGITNAYTKEEADTVISTAVANAGHLKREIVEILPSASSADVHTIYMIKDANYTDENNKYNEYMVIHGVWEKIGTSRVDLTGYATSTDVSTAKSEAITAAEKDATAKANEAYSKASTDLSAYQTSNDEKVTSNTTAIEAINNADTGILAKAKKYASDLGENYATKEQGTKADSALQEENITSGTSSGTIAVKGKEISVAGLKSAAYAETKDFDAAGSAKAAQDNAVAHADNLLTWKTIGS